AGPSAVELEAAGGLHLDAGCLAVLARLADAEVAGPEGAHGPCHAQRRCRGGRRRGRATGATGSEDARRTEASTEAYSRFHQSHQRISAGDTQAPEGSGGGRSRTSRGVCDDAEMAVRPIRIF